MEHSELKFTKLFQGQVQILIIKKSNTHEIYIHIQMATVNYLRDGKPKCSVEKPSSALTAGIKTCNCEK